MCMSRIPISRIYSDNLKISTFLRGFFHLVFPNYLYSKYIERGSSKNIQEFTSNEIWMQVYYRECITFTLCFHFLIALFFILFPLLYHDGSHLVRVVKIAAAEVYLTGGIIFANSPRDDYFLIAQKLF